MSLVDQVITSIQSLVQPAPLSNDTVRAALTAAATARLDEHLDWYHSIVDLLKVLKLDSSWEARKAMAKELGYNGALTLDESYEMNTWLHDEVIRRIADHYIKVPPAG